jgi:hypothetical protein
MTYSLVAFPAKDNYEGRLYPLEWIKKVTGYPVGFGLSADLLCTQHCQLQPPTQVIHLNPTHPDPPRARPGRSTRAPPRSTAGWWPWTPRPLSPPTRST